MSETDAETGVKVLSMLSEALTEPQTLQEALEHITEMTASLMETRQTAILLRDEGREKFIVKTHLGIESSEIRTGHPLPLPDRLERLLWRMRTLRQIGYVEAGIEGLAFPMLVIPIKVKGERIGLLVTGKPQQDGRFPEIKRRLFVLIASFASLVIENDQAYAYLNQQFAQRSQELREASLQKGGETVDPNQLMVKSLKNPDAVVRLLASSFYKELVRAGFSANTIATASAEILDCLTRNECAEQGLGRGEVPR